ncbi:S8 family serine peptidase [Paenibacillus albidus]|nr:S8 family serine peptidase [Paenibacillus albidus]
MSRSSAAGRMPENRRELIVISDPGVLNPPESSLIQPLPTVHTLLSELSAEMGEPFQLLPLFAREPEAETETVDMTAEMAEAIEGLHNFYRVDAPEDKLDQIAEKLRQDSRIQGAYVRPEPEIPRPVALEPEKDVSPLPSATPDFGERQGYLNAAPAGIDAYYAWTLPGGYGNRVRIIDLEGGWNFAHEDLQFNEQGVIGTANDYNDHGTAVLGVMGGDHDAKGIKGICPEARIAGIAWNESCASAGDSPDVLLDSIRICAPEAIRKAADQLRTGDILLLEMHVPGPHYNYVWRPDQRGYIAIEWYPDMLAAIKYAVAKGILVVEAAGNGGENLDAPMYDQPKDGFPPNWSNPFRRQGRDSGAILVGAGAPPKGTHGRNHGPERSRLDFSNYGSAIDAQGWGREVTTAGYGDLSRGSGENSWYTDQFSGTSSASPIVAGALACLQSIHLTRGGRQLPYATVREMLRTTGTPQQDAPGRPASQRIGNLPDLRAMISRLNGF